MELQIADRTVRKYIRKWCYLPHDTPDAFIHTAMKDGGLGITKYRTWVPMTRRRRLAAVLERASKEQDLPLLDALLRGRTLLKEAKQFGMIGQSDLTDVPKQLHNTKLADELYRSVDGKGLKESRTHYIPNQWLKDPKTLTGGDFVKCVQVRAASLYNGLRAARGMPARSTNCRAGCKEKEALSHIIQVCPRTSGSRTERHNTLAHKLASRLKSNGFEVREEPNIKTAEGIRKRDVVAWGRGCSWVTDVTIVSDVADLSREHEAKVKKYNRREIIDWMQANTPPGLQAGTPEFSSLSMNFRGIIARESMRDTSDRWVSRKELSNGGTQT